MTLVKNVCAIVLATSFLFAPGSASAQDGATLVAIVTAEPNAPLARRVRAELEGLGVDVIVLKPPAEDSTARAPLEQAARGVGAAAAIRLVASSEGHIEVWVADRVTGKTVVRELDAKGTEGSDASIAVGTVELLRASLMELHTTEPPHGEVKATPKLQALALPSSTAKAKTEPPRLGLAISGGAELGVRGLGPSADARLALWVRVVKQLGVRILGDATLVPSHTKTPDGSVDTRAQWVGASLVYDFTPPESRWVPEASLGISAAHLGTTGTARAPYLGTSAGAWVAAPFVGFGLGWAFTKGIRLRADALALFALPPIRVRTPTVEAGRWGAPAIMLAPGLEFLWSP